MVVHWKRGSKTRGTEIPDYQEEPNRLVAYVPSVTNITPTRHPVSVLYVFYWGLVKVGHRTGRVDVPLPSFSISTININKNKVIKE